jgi:hypothetical protein
VGETPGKPELHYQRGFFIVPAAPGFVNEGRLPQAYSEVARRQALLGFWLVIGANCAKQRVCAASGPERLCGRPELARCFLYQYG